jgi:2-haloacid dehalogenase
MSRLKIPSASRRDVLAAIAVSAAVPVLARPPARLSAIAFDAFVLFSTSAIVRRAEVVLGEKATAFVASASARLFAYTWLYTSAGRYAGFETLARDAFEAAASALGSELGSSELEHIVSAYSSLDPWPDVAGALDALRDNGIRLAILSNLPRRALQSSLVASGIDRHFEQVLSTDEVGRFKPAPQAYALASSRLQARAASIGFAASAGWDASGATWFGYPTAWVNRTRVPAEAAHATPDIISAGMEGVLRLARIEQGPGSSARNLFRSSSE